METDGMEFTVNTSSLLNGPVQLLVLVPIMEIVSPSASPEVEKMLSELD
jgi:hypothetical protein